MSFHCRTSHPTHSDRDSVEKEAKSPNMHTFRMWEEDGVPWGMQTWGEHANSTQTGALPEVNCFFINIIRKQCWMRQSHLRTFCVYSQIIFDKEERKFNGESINFSTMVAWATGHSHAEKKKKKNIDTNLRLFIKVNPKWITDLKVKSKN